MHLYLLSTL